MVQKISEYREYQWILVNIMFTHGYPPARLEHLPWAANVHIRRFPYVSQIPNIAERYEKLDTVANSVLPQVSQTVRRLRAFG